nr:MAG TPA: hypothetical protein [Bacteriophage sp.]
MYTLSLTKMTKQLHTWKISKSSDSHCLYIKYPS